MTAIISPCCKAEMYLSAQWEGKALYKCSKCGEYKVPVGHTKYTYKPKVNRKDQTKRKRSGWHRIVELISKVLRTNKGLHKER